MSLFEDLIDELKEDNLLEETIIETVDAKDKATATAKREQTVIAEQAVGTGSVSNGNGRPAKDELPLIINKEDLIAEPDNPAGPEPLVVSADEVVVAVDVEATVEKVKPGTETGQEETQVVDEKEALKKAIADPAKEALDERDFYRRRALDEVNGLEMVDHVLSGVEREMMKVMPKPYENYGVKQALHEFLQVAEDINSPNHAELEFNLMKETEQWYSHLAERDAHISVGNLRRYCETTKPSLSSQALISLARFYRNSTHSESVRGKFDLIATRLFSTDVDGAKRELLFAAEDLVKHIQELYADWSSTPLYSTDENDSELLLAALKFQDFIEESENAETFDELIKKDFFKRLKVFKEKTNENFFAPILVAAAVECNVTVGNRYIDLIGQVRNSAESGELTDKYGNIHDKAISEATSKTLDLLEIIKEKKSATQNRAGKSAAQNKTNDGGSSQTAVSDEQGQKVFGANRWLVFATGAAVVIALMYFVFGGSASAPVEKDFKVAKDVKIVNLENSSLKEYIESARISKRTLFAIANQSWEDRDYSQKEEIVGKFLATGDEKGFKNVHILNKKGETVAFGSREGINIVQ